MLTSYFKIVIRKEKSCINLLWRCLKNSFKKSSNALPINQESKEILKMNIILKTSFLGQQQHFVLREKKIGLEIQWNPLATTRSEPWDFCPCICIIL